MRKYSEVVETQRFWKMGNVLIFGMFICQKNTHPNLHNLKQLVKGAGAG